MRQVDALCTVDPCYVPGSHTTNGCDRDCRGCLPGLALPGLRVCRHHYQRARRDLTRLPTVDADLTTALTRSGSTAPAGRVTGSTTPGLTLDPAVFEFRDYMRERLAAIIGYVVTERGLTGPAKWDVPAVCVWIAGHHDWLCASRLASTYVQQLGKLATRGFGVAHPSGTRTIHLGPCTEHTTSPAGERVPCPGTLRAVLRDTTSLLPSELTCDGPEPHHVLPHEWMALGRRLHGAAGIKPDAAQARARRISG